MNLIITAGGTRERIDSVRTITNDATGRLGSLIAEEFSRRLGSKVHKIFYLCGIGSVVPDTKDTDIQVIFIEGTEQLQSEICHLLTTQKIHAVIHSMAVSDYKVRCVTTLELIAQELDKKSQDFVSSTTDQGWKSVVMEVIERMSIQEEQKISSELEHPLLVLEKTPKIIGMIKQISPQTILIGFKLLSGVSKDKLIETAYGLLQRNKCDYVLANDTDSLKNGNHEGYLIDGNGNAAKYIGKEQIAAGIVDKILHVEGSTY